MFSLIIVSTHLEAVFPLDPLVSEEDTGLLRLPTRGSYVEAIWDHAAGSIIIQEAGGKVTDLKGKNLDFSAGRKLSRNKGVIASNGKLHERVLEAVHHATHPKPPW